MAELYYNQLDEAAREKIGFVLVNDDGAAADRPRLESSGSYQGKKLPVVQDDGDSTLMNALSNNDPYPKDDMAVVDRNGRMIKYFDSRSSSMSNRGNNNVRSFVMDLTQDSYENPCGNGDNEKTEVDEKTEVEKLADLCSAGADNCAACKGRWKNSACKLKKKMKCRLLQNEAMCTKAKCKFAKAKPARKGKKAKPAKCKGKGIFGKSG